MFGKKKISMYWIKGSKTNPAGVRKALKEKGILTEEAPDEFFAFENVTYYGRTNGPLLASPYCAGPFFKHSRKISIDDKTTEP